MRPSRFLSVVSVLVIFSLIQSSWISGEYAHRPFQTSKAFETEAIVFQSVGGRNLPSLHAGLAWLRNRPIPDSVTVLQRVRTYLYPKVGAPLIALFDWRLAALYAVGYFLLGAVRTSRRIALRDDQAASFVADYFQRLRAISPPGEGAVRGTGYFPGNERITTELLDGRNRTERIRNRGGVMVAVGPGLALEYAFHAKSSRAVFIDFDSIVTEVVWPIEEWLYVHSATRTEWVGTMMGVSFSPDEIRKLSRRPLSEIWAAASQKQSAPALRGQIEFFTALLEPHVSPEVRAVLPEAITQLLVGTLPMGSPIEREFKRENRALISFEQPNFKDSDRHDGIFASEKGYRWAQNFILDKKVSVVTGDLGGEAARRVAEDLRRRREKASLVYVSNVLESARSADHFHQLFRSIACLPVKARALLLATAHGGIWAVHRPIKDVLANAYLWALPSEHSREYRMLMNLRLLTQWPELSNPSASFNEKISAVCQIYFEATAGFARLRVNHDREQSIGRIGSLYASFSDATGEEPYAKKAFESTEALRAYFTEQGFSEIDWFDWVILVKAFEIAGFLRATPSASILPPEGVYKNDRVLFSKILSFLEILFGFTENHAALSLRGVPPGEDAIRGFANRSPNHFVFLIYRMKEHLGTLTDKRILEVGAGWGGLTWTLRQLGVDAQGAELTPRLIRFARWLGLEIHQHDLLDEDGTVPGAPFDVTTSFYVWQALRDVDDKVARDVSPEKHHTAALRALKRVAALTRPGGWSFHQYPGSIYFTPEEIHEAGFEIVELKKNGDVIMILRRLDDVVTAPKALLGAS